MGFAATTAAGAGFGIVPAIVPPAVSMAASNTATTLVSPRRRQPAEDAHSGRLPPRPVAATSPSVPTCGHPMG